jgi:hypothetical protein
MVFKVPYLLVTNGSVHYVCWIEHATGRVDFLPNIPAFALMQAALSR